MTQTMTSQKVKHSSYLCLFCLELPKNICNMLPTVAKEKNENNLLKDKKGSSWGINPSEKPKPTINTAPKLQCFTSHFL